MKWKWKNPHIFTQNTLSCAKYSLHVNTISISIQMLTNKKNRKAPFFTSCLVWGKGRGGEGRGDPSFVWSEKIGGEGGLKSPLPFPSNPLFWIPPNWGDLEESQNFWLNCSTLFYYISTHVYVRKTIKLPHIPPSHNNKKNFYLLLCSVFLYWVAFL